MGEEKREEFWDSEIDRELVTIMLSKIIVE